MAAHDVAGGLPPAGPQPELAPQLSASPAPQGVTPNNDDDDGSSNDLGSARYLRACDNCRHRKVKCDSVRPACGHCKRVETPCHYSVKPKSRRLWKCLENQDEGAVPGGGGAAGAAPDARARDDNTAKLLARMETMERLLMQRTGMALPRSASGAAGAGDLAAYAPGGGAAAAAAAAGAAGSGAAGMPTPLLPAQRQSSVSVPGEAGHAEAGGGGRRDGIPAGLGSVFGGADGAGGGEARGHAQSAPGGPLSPEVMSDLVDTLFSGPLCIADLLHEKTFRRQFATGTLAPLLLYSALASAARYSKNPAVRTDPPYSSSTVYLARAKVLAVDAIEDPSLGNAQGLLMMCLMHFSLGNEVLSTFYKALALNMCIILGYNRLDSVNGGASGANTCIHEMMPSSTMSMDWIDRESARRLWWTIFSIENYSSVCMGLAPSIQAECCDVKLPASTTEWLLGRPDPDADQAEPSSKRPRIAENPLHQLSAYQAQLSLIFSKVAWLVTRADSSAEEAVAQFAELNTVLQRWYEGLPKGLRLSSIDTLLYGAQDSADCYQICVLHMRFYTTVIQLNHAIPEFTEDPAVIEPGQRKCVIAASRISDLLRSSFEIPVEARDMNWYMCVFRAAHIHIYRLLSRDAESTARAKQDLAIHRRHLREGGPLWRICYKLLSRLDDMEQMVMLLPAQIPVADLIKIKHLTRKGKSQLVNMQLDSLIKPTLIHSEHAESEDLPLAARVADRPDGSSPPYLGQRQQQQQQNQQAAEQHRVRAGSLGNMSAVDAFLGGGGGGGGDVTGCTPKHSSPLSMASGSSSNPFTPLSSFGGQPGAAAGLVPLGQHQQQQQSGVAGALAHSSSSSSASMPMGALPDQHHQHHHHGTKGVGSGSALGSVSAPMLHMANELPPINTNIVIDNNMAETLVNYFYMVASNNNNQQGLQSPPQGLGNGLPPQHQQQQQHQDAVAVSLPTPQMAVGGSSGMTSTLPSAAAPSLATGSRGPPQQEPQQSLFGGAYDFAGLQGLANNGGGSFI
ncbi:hypothetical protein H4R18_004780 [Coemansia javaensis]|uniref:Zn(2)-C6 fungal-type domain-containing protein n=1 Tax=Coemansia javaensis TaxID=2761396 RepID=A0A9W8H6X2_9FUNG|nr:hypothetical protein H4R18_004780 [Coemansia javaensis]